MIRLGETTAAVSQYGRRAPRAGERARGVCAHAYVILQSPITGLALAIVGLTSFVVHVVL